MPTPERPYLRLHREPARLGAYVRPLERDYRHTAELLAAGYSVGTGIVIDARHAARSEDLRAASATRGLEMVLDPKSLELSTAGGVQRAGILDLPWSTGSIDTPASFDDERIDEYAEQLAASAVALGVASVLAPTHFLEGELTPWLDVDLALARRLRLKLDQDSSGRKIRIYYPLASSFAAVRPTPALARVVDGLRGLVRDGVIKAVWLRIHNFGTNSAGPSTLLRYVDLTRALHVLGVPVVGDRTGGVGVPLLAFGAIAAIESGITHGERFDFREMQKERKDRPKGGLAPRVYVPAIGVYLSRDDAAKLLSTRGMSGVFGCQLPCCPQGAEDMLSDPRRHFLVTRSHEVSQLSNVPESMRVEHYFARWLRLAADRASRAARVIHSLESHRKRLDMWRATFTTLVDEDGRVAPTVTQPLDFDFPSAPVAARGLVV